LIGCYAGSVPIKEELQQEVDVFTFRWDEDEDTKMRGDSLALEANDENHVSMLLNSDALLSLHDLELRSSSAVEFLTANLPSSPEPLLSAGPLSSPSLSPQLTDSLKGSSNPSSPFSDASSPLPSSPSPAPLLPTDSSNTMTAFLQPRSLTEQAPQHSTFSALYSSCGVAPHLVIAGPTNAAAATATAQTPLSTVSTPLTVSSVRPTTPATSGNVSPSPRASRARRDSLKGSGSGKKMTSVSSSRPRRRRAASTTAAREKQDRLEKDLASDDAAKAILAGPLTLEKLASLSSLKVSVLQKQLRMVNASTKGSKAQLIQRLVRYMYLFSQQHHHQLHHDALSLITCGLEQSTTGYSSSGGRCNGPFVDPTLINAEFGDHKPVRVVKTERGVKRSSSHRDGPAPDDPSVLSSSAPTASFATFLSTHVFPSPLQITLTGRIVEEEEEEEFSD